MYKMLTLSVICLFLAYFVFFIEGATTLVYIVLSITFVCLFLSFAEYLKTL